MNRLRMGLLATAALAACGARTGLRVPDAEFPTDAVDVTDVTDVFDVPRMPVCLTGHFPLVARAADMVLVVDRSGSMDQGLDGTMGRRGTSKWSLLRQVLGATLPRYEDQINTGALFFPQDGAASRVATCALPNIPSVDIEPGVSNASRVLSVFDATGPGGSTPTAAALLRAYTWVVRHPNRARARYLVLATDGGPNCNAALNPSTCTCTGGPGGGGGGRGCGGASDGTRCLDDTRTVREIAEIATNPVSPIATFVVGMAGESSPSDTATLTAMAIAGGRPNHTARGEPTYYDVRQAGDLAAAFTTIQNTVARCTFVTPSQPTDMGTISVQLNGATVPFDPTRRNGWDWTDRAYGEITLFGAACPDNASPATTASATVECDADGG